MTTRILIGDVRQVLATMPDESERASNGCFVAGVRAAPATEFKAGQHWRQRKPHWDKEWLEREYVGNGRPAADIAAEAGITENAVFHWLSKHGIRRRSMAEVRALKHWGVSGPANPMFGKTGPASPAYIAGTSPERGKLFSRAEGKAFRAAVLERDGFTCRRCGCAPVGRWALPVHHIKPWARHPALRYDVDNGATLCKPCHLWVHSKKNAKKEWLA